jgi:DNA-3-methyladenine glycosylase II
MTTTQHSILIPSRSPFNLDLALAYFRRRAGELVDAVKDQAYRRLLLIDGELLLVEARSAMNSTRPALEVRLLTGEAARLEAAADALRRSFGLEDDLSELDQTAAGDAPLSELIERRKGLRLVRTQTAFEALVWAIIGQQINLTFAFRLKSILVRGFGEMLEFQGEEYWAFPTPERLSEADEAQLASTGLGPRKAATIVSMARAIASGEIDLQSMAALPRVEAEARLTSRSGIGPWTAHYTFLRGLGDFGAFPASDLGLRAAAGRLYNGGEIAPMPLMRELAERWGEQRGYVAFYLWNSLAERAA